MTGKRCVYELLSVRACAWAAALLTLRKYFYSDVFRYSPEKVR